MSRVRLKKSWYFYRISNENIHLPSFEGESKEKELNYANTMVVNFDIIDFRIPLPSFSTPSRSQLKNDATGYVSPGVGVISRTKT